MTTDNTGFKRDLSELNEGFLALVAEGVDADLPGSVLSRLRRLDAVARRRLAGVSFALFGYGFDDKGAWAGLLSPGVRDLVPGYDACAVEVERFTLLSLTVLRGLVRVAPRAVAAWIGLPDETRRRLAELEIGLLAPVAVAAAPRLRGRLPAQETLWHRLIDAALGNDERRFALLASQGKQWTIRRSLGLDYCGSRPRHRVR